MTPEKLVAIRWRTRYRPEEAEEAGDSWAQAAADRAALLAHIDAITEAGPWAEAYIRVRHAHNPTPDELEADQEVRPCAWCRLAAEQTVEALALLRGTPEEAGDYLGALEPDDDEPRETRGVFVGGEYD